MPACIWLMSSLHALVGCAAEKSHAVRIIVLREGSTAIEREAKVGSFGGGGGKERV
jgi:hypothetical protein